MMLYQCLLTMGESVRNIFHDEVGFQLTEQNESKVIDQCNMSSPERFQFIVNNTQVAKEIRQQKSVYSICEKGKLPVRGNRLHLSCDRNSYCLCLSPLGDQGLYLSLGFQQGGQKDQIFHGKVIITSTFKLKTFCWWYMEEHQGHSTI